MTLVDLGDRRVLAEVPVGKRPWSLALTPDGSKLYVANARSNSLPVIDVVTRRAIAEIALGATPFDVAMA